MLPEAWFGAVAATARLTEWGPLVGEARWVFVHIEQTHKATSTSLLWFSKEL